MVSANPQTSVNRWLFSCKSLRFCISVEVMKSWELVFDRLVFGKLLNHGPCFPGEETLDDDELEPLQRVWRCASRFYSRRRIRLSESNASSLRSRSRTGRSHSGLGWKLATRSGMLTNWNPLNVSPCLVLSFIIANKSRTQLQCYICGSTAIILLRVSFPLRSHEYCRVPYDMWMLCCGDTFRWVIIVYLYRKATLLSSTLICWCNVNNAFKW